MRNSTKRVLDMRGRGLAIFSLLSLLQHTSSSASGDDATAAGLFTADAKPPPNQPRRGLRWAVNFPDAVEPFLLGDNPGHWANTSRSVADATVGIVVQPVFSIPTSGELVTLMPAKLPPSSSSLLKYANMGLEVILSIGPWVGSPEGSGGVYGGFVDRSGGYTGPALLGINCSSITPEGKAEAERCVSPDRLIRAALKKKEAFAASVLRELTASHATGFATDWEDSFGNNQTNAAALWGYTAKFIAQSGMKYYPWMNNGGGGNMGPLNYAYQEDYQKLLPFATQLMNMGSYSPLGASFGPGNERSIEPVLCTNRSAGVVEPSTAPLGRWCGLGGTLKDVLTHGGKPTQLSPGIWMDACDASGLKTNQGWTQATLSAFLEYCSKVGATTVTMWSGLTASRKPRNVTVPAALSTCRWFVPTLLDWVEGSP